MAYIDKVLLEIAREISGSRYEHELELLHL